MGIPPAQGFVEAPRISIDEFEALGRDNLPFITQFGIRVERLEPGAILVRTPFHSDFLRPGGTINGPVMMTVADFAMYGVVLSLVGRVELAVTTSLNINFLRRPAPKDLLAEGRILKLGKRLAVGEVILSSDGDDDPVAHATCTYSIPPVLE